MLKQASVQQLRRGEISRQDGYIVVATRFYPRGLRREQRDEYVRALSPERDLLVQLKELQARLGDEGGFARARYQEKFQVSPEAMAHLEELAERSKREDVFLVCQCPLGNPCHREMLLLLAQKKFGAKISPLSHEYKAYRRRMKL